MSFKVFAPGKLVLLGEYAVLDGAPALVAAINHGVHCEVIPGGTDVRVETDKDPSFVRAVFDAYPPRQGCYRFSNSHSYSFSGKPGFGSSASATVCAVAASLASRHEKVQSELVFSMALKMHHEVQGSGSGIDIAASAYGGVLRYQHHQATSAKEVHPTVIWSGQSAKTGPRLERYLAWKARQSFVDASDAAVARFETEPIAAFRQAADALGAMAKQAGVEWSTPALERIMEHAEDVGGAAKPSGAGGGDSAVALFPDEESRLAFEKRCQKDQFIHIPVTLAHGISVSSR